MLTGVSDEITTATGRAALQIQMFFSNFECFQQRPRAAGFHSIAAASSHFEIYSLTSTSFPTFPLKWACFLQVSYTHSVVIIVVFSFVAYYCLLTWNKRCEDPMYAVLKKKIAELEQKEEEAITPNNVKLQKLISERLIEAKWKEARNNKDEARMYHFERQLDKLYGFSSSSSSSGKTTLIQAKCVCMCVCAAVLTGVFVCAGRARSPEGDISTLWVQWGKLLFLRFVLTVFVVVHLLFQVVITLIMSKQTTATQITNVSRKGQY